MTWRCRTAVFVACAVAAVHAVQFPVLVGKPASSDFGKGFAAAIQAFGTGLRGDGSSLVPTYTAEQAIVSDLSNATTSQYAAVVGASLELGYPDHWQDRHVSLIAPTVDNRDDLRISAPHTPISLSLDVDTRIVLGLRATVVAPRRAVSGIIVVQDTVSSMCEHVVEVVEAKAAILGIPSTVVTVTDFTLASLQTAIFANVTDAGKFVFALCMGDPNESAAVVNAIHSRVPIALGTSSDAAVAVDALHSAPKIGRAITALGAPGEVRRRVVSVSWLPHATSGSTNPLVTACRDTFTASGHDAQDHTEEAVEGCAAAMILAHAVNATALAPSNAPMNRVLQNALMAVGAFYLPLASGTSGASGSQQLYGPFDTGCGVGAPAAVTIDGDGRVLHTRVLDHEGARACDDVDDELRRVVYMLQVVNTATDANRELADALYRGAVRRHDDSDAAKRLAVHVHRVFVSGELEEGTPEFEALEARLSEPLTVGLIASVGVSAEAIGNLGALSLGAEHAVYHFGADATDVVGDPHDVSAFGSFASDVYLCARFAIDLYGVDGAGFLRISMQPSVALRVAADVKREFNARLQQLGAPVLARTAMVSQAVPSVPAAHDEPVLLLVLGDVDAPAYFSSVLALVASRSTVTAIIPRVVHERAWFRAMCDAWRSTVARTVSARLVFLGDGAAVTSLAHTIWGAQHSNRTREARGYALAQMAEHVAADVPLQDQRRAVMFAGVYHQRTWSVGNLTVSGLHGDTCSGSHVEGTVLHDVFTPTVTDFGGHDHLHHDEHEEHTETVAASDADDDHDDDHDDGEVDHSDGHAAHGHVGPLVKVSPCACNQRTLTRNVVTANGDVVLESTFDPCDKSVNLGAESIQLSQMGIFVGIAAALAAMALVRAIVAWWLLRTVELDTDEEHAKESKAAAESAAEKMPLMYRVPAVLYMLPMFVVPVVLVHVIAIAPMSAALDTASSETHAAVQALGKLEDIVTCVQSSVAFAVDIGNGVPAEDVGSFNQQLCERLDDELQSTVSVFQTEVLNARSLPLRRTRPAVAATALALLAPLSVAASELVVTITASTSGSQRAHIPRVAHALVISELALPVVTAILPPESILSSSVSVQTEVWPAIRQILVSTQRLRTLLPSANGVDKIRLAYGSDAAMREYFRVLECVLVGRDGTANFISTARRDQCLRHFDPVTSEALVAAVSTAEADTPRRFREISVALSRIHDDDFAASVDRARDHLLWRIIAVCVAVAVMCLAACVMQSSHTHNFLRAFREIAVLEAAVSRWIPLAILDVMRIDSVHDIDDEPELREIAIVFVDYERAFAAAVKEDDSCDEVELLRRVVDAVVSSLADDGEIEHVTTSSCCVLCEHSDAALLAAIELEHTVRSVFVRPNDVNRSHNSRDALESSGARQPEGLYIGVGVHRDTVSVGFMASDKHTFGGAFGHGVRIARMLARLCPVYSAAVLVSTATLDSVDRRSIDLRDLGTIVTRQYGPLGVMEALIMMDRSDLDAYKRETLQEFNRIAAAQAEASIPATDDEVHAVAQAIQRCHHFASVAGVQDPALRIKMAWGGKHRADDVSAYVDF